MSRSSVERRLSDVAERLTRLREELRVLDEQLAHHADTADELRVRALVSDDRRAAREHRAAQKHVDSHMRRRDEVRAEIERLERRQDELLDDLIEQSR